MSIICAIDIAGKARNGLAIRNEDGELLAWDYLKYEGPDPYTHRKKLIRLIENYYQIYKYDIILYEQINLFRKGLINLGSIVSLARVQTSILDNFSDKCKIIEIPVRSWKSMILKDYHGASSDKDDSVNWVIDNEIDKNKKDIDLLVTTGGPRKQYLEFNHDMADAICQSAVISCDKFKKEYLSEKSKYNVTKN